MAATEILRRESQRSVPLWLFIVATVLVAARVWVESRPDRPSNDLVKWVTPGDAKRLARETGKPILYDFTADWCKPCDVLDEEVFRDPSAAARINAQFIPVRIVDRMREEGRNRPGVDHLKLMYNVRVFPTVIIADSAGILKTRLEGYRSRDAFEETIVLRPE